MGEMFHALYSPAGTIFLIIGYLGPCPGWEHFCSTHNSWSALYLWYWCLPSLPTFTVHGHPMVLPSLSYIYSTLKCGLTHSTFVYYIILILAWPTKSMPSWLYHVCSCRLAPARPTFTSICTSPLTHFCKGVWLNYVTDWWDGGLRIPDNLMFWFSDVLKYLINSEKF